MDQTKLLAQRGANNSCVRESSTKIDVCEAPPWCLAHLSSWDSEFEVLFWQ